MTGAAVKLLARQPGDVIAIRQGRAVTAAEFLAEVNALAGSLPASGFAINVCENRYHFLVGFAAALAHGLATLLPPNPLEETVNAIHREWAGSFVLTDTPGRRFDAPVFLTESSATGQALNFEIASGMLAAIAFTSGSTGSSMPQEKTWRTLVDGAAINLRYYLGPDAGVCAVVSTVPAQHMYGLETSVLPALRGSVALHDGRPFYPANVVLALQEAPAPRVLVSTPIHLRALAACGLVLPPVARVLSATAPLDSALAISLEALFGAELIEIYGCTEAGSLAWRRTAIGECWRFFDGIHPVTQVDSTWVTAEHLPAAVRLPDVIEIRADGSFLLVGRDSDLVKIGGKRGSLAEITRRLLAVRGVEDAVVFSAPGSSDEVRLAALVVAPSIDAAAVRAGLRSVLDPVFIPRPILQAPALPRSANGKLAREAVLRLYDEVTRTAARGAGGLPPH